MYIAQKRPKKQDADAHERVRNIVAKGQRHPLGAAKCEIDLDNLSHHGVRNSHFDFQIVVSKCSILQKITVFTCGLHRYYFREEEKLWEK